jgi:hypothetical protein
VRLVEWVLGLRLVIEVGNQKSWLMVAVAALAAGGSVAGKLARMHVGVALVAGSADGPRRRPPLWIGLGQMRMALHAAHLAVFALQGESSPLPVIKRRIYLAEGNLVVAADTALLEIALVWIAMTTLAKLRLPLVAMLQSPQPTWWLFGLAVAVAAQTRGLFVRSDERKTGPELVIEIVLGLKRISIRWVVGLDRLTAVASHTVASLLVSSKSVLVMATRAALIAAILRRQMRLLEQSTVEVLVAPSAAIRIAVVHGRGPAKGTAVGAGWSSSMTAFAFQLLVSAKQIEFGPVLVIKGSD